MSADDLVAGTLLIVGLGLYYVARRRVFNRRNEELKSKLVYDPGGTAGG